MGAFVVDALQLNFDHLKSWAKSAPISMHHQGHPIIQIENRDLDKAFSMLEVYGVPRQRARYVSNGIDVLGTRFNKEINFREQERNRLLAIVKEYAGKDEGGNARTLLAEMGIAR